MQEGGKASFLIPSKLAYGSSGYYTIGGYTPLLYDVELLLVKPGPGK
jgi:FKBP-type peptidyl-prolyl cis-trans isomerase